MKIAVLMLAMTVCCTTAPAVAALPASPGGPSLDLDIAYYTRVTTPEGVTREARYKEAMLRRPGHVWVERVLPPMAGSGRRDGATGGAVGHAEFNHAIAPHHVTWEKIAVRINYVDTQEKAVVVIPAAEYSNVNFDGSWVNSFFLIDPKRVSAMPRSDRKSPVVGAQWHEHEKNGVFERVLWDENRQIPLTIESGDKAATFYRRVDVSVRPALSARLPWLQLSGYSQKEFSDYLD